MCACLQMSKWTYINHELTLVTQQHHIIITPEIKSILVSPALKEIGGKQRTVYHAVNDFNSLSETIRM